jgi:hypothetical protein
MHVLVRIGLSVVFLVLVALCYVLRPQQWDVRKEFKLKNKQKIDHFSSGDLLYFFEHGFDAPWPGHLAIIVKLSQYAQTFVWDMPNPLFHGPDLLKPLHKYIANGRKRKKARFFVQQLRGPVVSLLPAIKYISSCGHFDLLSAVHHANFALRECLLLPGIPTNFLPCIEKNERYYCTSAIWTVLQRAGVLGNMPQSGADPLCPVKLLQDDFDLNTHVFAPWHYEAPVEI